MVTFACPACRNALTAPDQAVGSKVQCPSCGQRLQVPPPATLSPAPAVVVAHVSIAAEKPGKVQAVAIMFLVGGIWSCLHGVGVLLLCWPGGIYSIVFGILAIVKGSQLLGTDWFRMPVPVGTGVMQIITIVSFDIVNLILGIISVVFLNEPSVQAAFRGRRA